MVIMETTTMDGVVRNMKNRFSVEPIEIDWSVVPDLGWPKGFREVPEAELLELFLVQFGLTVDHQAMKRMSPEKKERAAKAVKALFRYQYMDEFERLEAEKSVRLAMSVLKEFDEMLQSEKAKLEAESQRQAVERREGRENYRRLREERLLPLLDELEEVVALMEHEHRRGDTHNIGAPRELIELKDALKTARSESVGARA